MVYNEIIYSSHLLRFWITNLGVPRSKRQGGSKVVPTVHLSEFDQMGTKNTGELGDSKKTFLNVTLNPEAAEPYPEI